MPDHDLQEFLGPRSLLLVPEQLNYSIESRGFLYAKRTVLHPVQFGQCVGRFSINRVLSENLLEVRQKYFDVKTPRGPRLSEELPMLALMSPKADS